MLLAGGDIVLIADSQGVRDSYEADGTVVDAKSQLAVLVNKGTASASEVLLPSLIHACHGSQGRCLTRAVSHAALLTTLCTCLSGGETMYPAFPRQDSWLKCQARVSPQSALIVMAFRCWLGR